MERDTILYKTRRFAQVAAHQFLPDELMSKFYFRIVLKKKLNLENPRTFNEKMQWLKLYYFPFDKNVIRCTDKYKVRGYMKERGYEDLLVPLIGCWEHAEEIDWELLPKQFVLKCNHGCAYNILCNDKSRLDKRHAIKQLNRWLKEDFGAFNIELHYSQIKPHLILCEEFLGDCIMDYKFFCFNGEPKFVYVSRDLIHDRQAQIGLFYLDGQKMPIKRDDYEDIESVEFPPFFAEMQETAKELCREFPFVRVDFFIVDDGYYFSELTFTPSACMMPIHPPEYDFQWGEMLEIEYLKNLKKHRR